jgi:uncharacterized protein YeeX (DUF496 family)
MQLSDLSPELQGIIQSARIAYNKAIECYTMMEPLSIYSGKYIDLKVKCDRYNYIFVNCVQYLREYMTYDQINELIVER